MNIVQKILTIYPSLSMNYFHPTRGSILVVNRSDGLGDQIEKWEHPIYSRPTQEQFDLLENVEYIPAIIEEYSNAIQSLIDTTAKSKQYADGVSLASYENSTITQWQTEAQVFIAWRDLVWQTAFNILDQYRSGIISKPTVDQILQQLPQIQWP